MKGPGPAAPDGTHRAMISLLWDEERGLRKQIMVCMFLQVISTSLKHIHTRLPTVLADSCFILAYVYYIIDNEFVL